MINLAGNKDADEYIEEELYLARIPTGVEVTDDEVPYTIIGRLSGWVFKRAWYYYVASCPDGLGLPYDTAVGLHERKYPISSMRYKTLGEAIRATGHCECPHPKGLKYATLAGIEREFVEARKRFPHIDFNSEETFNRSSTIVSDGVRYIRLYHIDTQVGLYEFANTIMKKEVNNG